MGRFIAAENGHIAQLIVPQDQTAALTSDSILMSSWDHASILIFAGAGSASTITVFDAASAAASGASMVFSYALEATASDVLDEPLQTAPTSGVALGDTSGAFMVIEIDSANLRDGYPFVLIRLDASGSKLVSACAVLSGGRVQRAITPTVLS